jgi:hypothetical protein
MDNKDPKKTEVTKDKLEKVRNDLDRVLRDYNLSQQEYNSLMDDMKKRRRRIDGAGDNIFDDIIDE